jgi:hypothetical protein
VIVSIDLEADGEVGQPFARIAANQVIGLGNQLILTERLRRSIGTNQLQIQCRAGVALAEIDLGLLGGQPDAVAAALGQVINRRGCLSLIDGEGQRQLSVESIQRRRCRRAQQHALFQKFQPGPERGRETGRRRPASLGPASES